MKIIDDFLPSYHFNQLQSIIFGKSFPWYYYPGTVMERGSEIPKGPSQFVSTFYNEDRQYTASTFYIIDPVLSYLNCQELKRVKANLNIKTLFHRKSGYHIDWRNVTTAVYYLNTNNGWTEFEKGGKVKSVANRIVIFDSNLKHQGVTCTDEKRRVVLNFNYVPAL